MNRRSARAVALAVALAVVVAGCGVEAQSSAERIEAQDVPFGLLAAPGPAPTTTAPAQPRVTFVVYFTGPEDTPVPTPRDAEPPLGLADVFNALLVGPTRAESSIGLRNRIPPETQVLQLRKVGGGRTLVVDLGGDFAQAAGGTQVDALAQIVFTATALEDIERVRFLLDGERVEVPRSDGTLARGPVDRDDYREEHPARRG